VEIELSVEHDATVKLTVDAEPVSATKPPPPPVRPEAVTPKLFDPLDDGVVENETVMLSPLAMSAAAFGDDAVIVCTPAASVLTLDVQPVETENVIDATVEKPEGTATVTCRIPRAGEAVVLTNFTETVAALVAFSYTVVGAVLIEGVKSAAIAALHTVSISSASGSSRHSGECAPGGRCVPINEIE
jgi:hypothetical protein